MKSSSASSLTCSTGNSSALVSQAASNDSDDAMNENYITLLRYRDAYHIFGLKHPDDDSNSHRGNEYSSEDIFAAYRQCHQETLLALQKANAGKVNTLVMSQLNYLELKLRALDQARFELLGDQDDLNDGESVFDESNDEGGDAQDVMDDCEDSLMQSTVPEKVPSKEEDELQTIDIYFQPSKSSYKPNRPRNLSKDSTDMSSLSWLSKADSDDNLSQVLGPLKSKKPNSTSPRGIEDFPGEEQFSYEENSKQSRREPEKVARQRPPMPTRSKSSNTQTIEAARKGVLRALSEDDSECLPLEDYDDAMVMQFLQKALKDNLDVEDVREEQRVRDNNSPVKSVRSERSRRSELSHKSCASSKRSKSSQRSRRSNSSKLPALPSQRSSKSNPTSRSSTPTPPEEEYAEIDKLINNEEDYYDSILQSGMELAEDFCGVLNSCFWDANGALNTTCDDKDAATNGDSVNGKNSNDRGYDNASNSRFKEDDSYFGDEYTLGTDGESTAFNTTSSFGHVPEVGTPESYMERRYSHREKKMLV
ncbi:hypothetical protein ACHAWO_009781 [Cyclotella atomus]|uniref:Uncharacterized protein n=1 Tax=Cyclotella atomus TaxID=382360 RepID=A0ABD3NBG3_9STRA